MANEPSSQCARRGTPALLFQIEGPFRRSARRIFLGLLQQFLESLFPDFVAALIGSKTLGERFIPVLFLTFELLHCHLQIFDHRLPLGFTMVNHDLCLRIDPQCRFATRTLHLEHLTARFRHTGIVSQPARRRPAAILWTASAWKAVFSWITQYGYAGLFVLLMLGIVGLPVPDETLLMFCGYLIWKGRLQTTGAWLAAFAGSLSGITLSYLLGRHFGVRVLDRYGRYLGASPVRLARVYRWFNSLGLWLLSVGYFIPGVRHFTALVAGLSDVRFPKFALYAYAGAAIWVTVFLTAGYLVGESWHRTSESIHRYALLTTVLAIALIAATWAIKNARERNRRHAGTPR